MVTGEGKDPTRVKARQELLPVFDRFGGYKRGERENFKNAPDLSGLYKKNTQTLTNDKKTLELTILLIIKSQPFNSINL